MASLHERKMFLTVNGVRSSHSAGASTEVEVEVQMPE